MIEFLEDILISIIDYKPSFIGEASIDIDNCLWIRNDGGLIDLHFENQTYDKPDYKIYVRNTSNEQARSIIYSIYNKLKSYKQNNYVIIADRLPRFVGRDIKNRAIYSLTIQIQLGG